MRVELGHLRCSLSIAFAAWVCLPLAPALAQQKTEDNGSITNAEAAVTATPPRRNSLKELEEQLRRSLRPFSPKGSLDGVLAPEYGTPPPAVVTPARKRNAAKENNGWIFPDDLTGDQSAADPFAGLEAGTDGKSRKKAASDPYYRSLNRNTLNTAEASSLMGIDPASSLKKATLGTVSVSGSDDSNLPSGIRDSAQSLQKMLERSSRDSDFSMPTGAKSSFSDFFGMGDRGLTTEQIQAHKSYMQQFQQLLDGNPASMGGSLQSSPTTFGGSAATPAASSLSGSLGGLSKPAGSAGWNAFDSKPGAINPTLTPSAVPDINAHVLNQWNSFAPPPQPEPTRVSPPTPAYVAFPHRKF